MRKFNLLYLITKLELGGAQKQLLSLIRYLDRDRYNIFLITSKRGLLVEEALSIDGLRVNRLSSLARPINPLKDILAFVVIYNFIKRNKIDIVHTHSSKAGILGRWAAKLAGVNMIVHTVHGWSFNDYQNLLLRQFYIALERFTAKITDKLIVVSNIDMDRGIRKYIGEQTKYILIRYGINHGEFINNLEDNVKIRREIGLNDNEFLVGMISCFKPQKAPLDYIKLAASVRKFYPQTKFILVGDGILRRKIEKLIDKFNLRGNIILTGWRRDIPRILSAIDVFVLTSLWEGLPIAVLEAMVSSKPVVTTNTGGVSEIVKHGENGFLVPCRDIEAMKEKIFDLLKDAEFRYRIGRRAKQDLNSDFRIEGTVRQIQSLYEYLIKDRDAVYVS